MRRNMTFVLACSLAFLGLTREASAVPGNVESIPNGQENSCLNCHNTLAGGSNNLAAMGEAYQNAAGSWSALANLDSDSDGQTNGQELGDPCGVWQSGLTPTRTASISNPSDPNDTSADPGSTANCPADSPLTGSVEDGGGCRSVRPNGDGLTFALLALGLAGMWRRRRRAR